MRFKAFYAILNSPPIRQWKNKSPCAKSSGTILLLYFQEAFSFAASFSGDLFGKSRVLYSDCVSDMHVCTLHIHHLAFIICLRLGYGKTRNTAIFVHYLS